MYVIAGGLKSIGAGLGMGGSALSAGQMGGMGMGMGSEYYDVMAI